MSNTIETPTIDPVDVRFYRNRSTGEQIEHETPLGDPLAVGLFFAPATVVVATPQGQRPIQVRVPLKGATSPLDALARLKELVQANYEEATKAQIQAIEEQQRREALAARPPLIPDSPNQGRRR